jgi:hypothetical protein
MSEQFDTLEELEGRVEEFLSQVTSETMPNVYEHWIKI